MEPGVSGPAQMRCLLSKGSEPELPRISSACSHQDQGRSRNILRRLLNSRRSLLNRAKLNCDFRCKLSQNVLYYCAWWSTFARSGTCPESRLSDQTQLGQLQCNSYAFFVSARFLRRSDS